MALEAKIDLEKLAKAVVLKDDATAAAAVGNAVIRAAETACHMFRNSLELDMTDYILESVKYAKDSATVPWKNNKASVRKRGRKPKYSMEACNG